MIEEQFKKDDSGKEIPKLGSEISSESLQNPTDPDTTYRKKYGDNIGYVANVAEAISDGNSVIINYDLKPNIYSDSKFADDVIEKLSEEDSNNDDFRTQLIVDGGYYEQEKAEEASSKGIDIIPGELVGRKPAKDKLSYAQFKVKDKNVIEKCPADQVPIESYYNEQGKSYTAKFDKEQCENCPHRNNCPAKDQKKNTVVRFSEKRYKTDLQRQKMSDPEYIKLTNQRAGVEGIPSVLRRKYNVDHMPIRGLVRSKIWFGFKIAAYNIKKLLKQEMSLGANHFSHTIVHFIYRLYQIACILFSKNKVILVH